MGEKNKMAYKIPSKKLKEKKISYQIINGEKADLNVRGYYLTVSEYSELLDKYRFKPYGTQVSKEDIEEIISKRNKVGKVEIYYKKNPDFREVSELNKESFKEEYVKLPKNESETDLEEIYTKYNQYSTNPYSEENDEGQKTIKSLGLHHTSMSVGDIIKTPKGYYAVANFGFKKIKWKE